MSVNKNPLSCWVVTEGMAGTENQCLGVAEALGIPPIVHRISLRQPWKSLTPWLGLEQPWTFMPPFSEPWPDLLLASGRKSVAASRFIKKASKGRTFTVQIQDPKTSPEQFDLVAVPRHDFLRGPNVVVTLGAPNRLNSQKLAEAKSDFAHLFSPMPSPRIAVLIGGSSKTHSLTIDHMSRLGAQLRSLEGGLMITASRRTGPQEKNAMIDSLETRDYYFWDGTGDNPYFGILAWADYILVTEDSVSMLSDAATTGKPVYTIPLDGGSRRFDLLHAGFREEGIARPFAGRLEHWEYPALNDSALIARDVMNRINCTRQKGNF